MFSKIRANIFNQDTAVIRLETDLGAYAFHVTNIVKNDEQRTEVKAFNSFSMEIYRGFLDDVSAEDRWIKAMSVIGGLLIDIDKNGYEFVSNISDIVKLHEISQTNRKLYVEIVQTLNNIDKEIRKAKEIANMLISYANQQQ